MRLIVSEEEQTRLNERLLTTTQLSTAMRRVHTTVDKLLLVLDFSLEMINNEPNFSPDVLMLQLSGHGHKSGKRERRSASLSKRWPQSVPSSSLDTIDSSLDTGKIVELCDVEKLESKLDTIVDRLLSVRSELIARQFENDLESQAPCRLQWMKCCCYFPIRYFSFFLSFFQSSINEISLT